MGAYGKTSFRFILRKDEVSHHVCLLFCSQQPEQPIHFKQKKIHQLQVEWVSNIFNMEVNVARTWKASSVSSGSFP